MKSPSGPTAPLIVDVRTPGEFAAGHVGGSVNVPLEHLMHTAATALPDRERPMVICCLSGARSGMAVQWLRAHGYSQVTNGAGVGGLALQLGRPIERG